MNPDVERALARRIEAGIAAEQCHHDPDLRAQIAPTATDAELTRLSADGRTAAGELVEGHAGYVYTIMAAAGPMNEDRRQRGLLAAYEAAFKFDVDRARFTTYLGVALKTSAFTNPESSPWAAEQSRVNAIMEVRKRLEAAPTLKDQGLTLRQAVDTYRHAAAVYSQSVLSLDALHEDDDRDPLIQVSDPTAEQAFDAVLGDRVADLLSILTPAERGAVVEHFGLDGNHTKTLREMAQSHGEPVQQLSARVQAAMNKLRAATGRARTPDAPASVSLSECLQETSPARPVPKQPEVQSQPARQIPLF